MESEDNFRQLIDNYNISQDIINEECGIKLINNIVHTNWKSYFILPMHRDENVENFVNFWLLSELCSNNKTRYNNILEIYKNYPNTCIFFGYENGKAHEFYFDKYSFEFNNTRSNLNQNDWKGYNLDQDNFPKIVLEKCEYFQKLLGKIVDKNSIISKGDTWYIMWPYKSLGDVYTNIFKIASDYTTSLDELKNALKYYRKSECKFVRLAFSESDKTKLNIYFKPNKENNHSTSANRTLVKNDNDCGCGSDCDNIKNGFIDKEHNIIMFWSPRAACTTAIKMMFRYINKLKEAEEYKAIVSNPINDIHEYFSNVYAKKTGQVTKFYLKPDSGYIKFKVIRNPYTRAVSSFNFIKIWYPNDENLLKICFEDFLKILLQNDGKFILNNKEYSIITDHSKPQYIKGEESYIDHYVKIENGDNDLKVFNNQLSFKGIETYHHSKKTKMPLEKKLANISLKNLTIMPENYAVFYTNVTKMLVDQLYARDLEMYNYNFNDNMS